MATSTQQGTVTEGVRQPVREVWSVLVEDPETREVLEFEIDCRRNRFVGALRKYLLADGFDADTIEEIIDGGHFARDFEEEYRVPEMSLNTPIED